MSNYVFSKANLGFYPYALKADYEAPGAIGWPTDGVDVTDEVFEAYALSAPPAGKTRGADAKGQPTWVDLPAPSPSQLLTANTEARNALLSAAALAIAPLQDAVDLGSATPSETAALTVWKQYRVAVNRIDLSASNPTWPEPPSSPM